MGTPLRVAVFGASGRVGQTVVDAVKGAADMELAAGVDQVHRDVDFPWFTDVATALGESRPDVAVDFTVADAAAEHAQMAIAAGVSPVIGTTGMSPDQINAIRAAAERDGVGAFIAPNFAIGAVLMMAMAQLAAPHLDHVEVIELHHDQKIDAPSGTAAHTADLIAQARDGRSAIDTPTERFTLDGVRGGVNHGVRVHSVRLPGFVAHQEVIFGALGQTLTIRHDSTSRDSFMPGVLLAARRVRDLPGLVIGLEHLLFEESDDA
ncbi:MAG: 4-hydroxy-tetrahydrodipicolinate reductase [Chloroflexi bacterium]|nr:4-hydroxy-tetrahydrodipicolinate reductase [Chloroflexota bacterium]